MFHINVVVETVEQLIAFHVVSSLKVLTKTDSFGTLKEAPVA